MPMEVFHSHDSEEMCTHHDVDDEADTFEEACDLCDFVFASSILSYEDPALGYFTFLTVYTSGLPEHLPQSEVLLNRLRGPPAKIV